MRRVLLVAGLVCLAAATATAGPWQDKTREILAATIALRTASGHGQVPVMADYLAKELYAGGFEKSAVDIERFGETATLIARYRSESLSKKKPILLLAHMDVVDANREDWSLDPFMLTEEDGYFIGRGVQDNKFDIALLIGTFLRLRAESFKPDRDFILVFSGDEETAQATTARLAEKAELLEAVFALNSDAGRGRLDSNGKPLAYFLQAAEKTFVTFRVSVTNAGGHSSEPRTDNAIYSLATALGRIESYRFPVRINDITRAFMGAMGEIEAGATGKALSRLAAEPDDAQAADHLWRQPAYVGTTRTTCVATMLAGGHAENALPQRASATVNCRVFPGVNPEAIRDKLQSVVGTNATVAYFDKAFIGSASTPSEEVLAAIRQAVDTRVPGLPVIPQMSSGYTDGSFFRAAGVPTYGVGAVFLRAEDSFAHGLNERVPVASLAAGLEHWRTLLKVLGGD